VRQRGDRAVPDIDEVMAAQRDLVEPLARFEPRLVKMAPAGERPED
jgi:tRNA-splicing ligase RtcB (3'-phosphate/5'-hydroxy nucleic acid ligase)